MSEQSTEGQKTDEVKEEAQAASTQPQETKPPSPPLEDESPGGISRIKRWAIRLVILALVASVFYLLAERNRRFYFLSTEGEQLVVSRGTWLPSWKAPYQPEDPLMVAAYAPIEMPEGEHVPLRRFDERQDLDQVLFEILIEWAQAGILADEPEALGSGTNYLERAALLPGISGEQFTRIRALRAEVAFSEGRSQLVEALAILDSVNERLALAASGRTARARRAQALLQKMMPATEALNEALREMRAEPGSKASDLGGPFSRRVGGDEERPSEEKPAAIPASQRRRVEPARDEPASTPGAVSAPAADAEAGAGGREAAPPDLAQEEGASH